MHSYVNHSKQLKKYIFNHQQWFPQTNPTQECFLTKQQTRLTKRTTGWRWEKTDLEWKLKLSERKGKKNKKKQKTHTHFDKEKKCYFESRHILGRMGGNLKTAYCLFFVSSHVTHTSNPRKSVACLIEQKREGAAMSPWARHWWNAFCSLSKF